MKHLLVISPRLPPYNGADAQRARVLLPHLGRLGWHATVVAASEDSEAGALDPGLNVTLPGEIEIVRVSAWPRAIAGRLGLRQHALRAYLPWRPVLAKLQAARRFDAAFVSHTDFAQWPQTLNLRMPVVLDWQDPWLSDYYDRNPHQPKPGGGLRYAAMQAIARRYEPRVARHAAAHVVVSAHYSTQLRARYPDLADREFLTLPFAAAASDLAHARVLPPPSWPAPGRRWWVYAGRGGGDMHFALGALFDALRRAREREPARYADLGLWFVGTAYDPRVTRTEIAELAQARGVGDLVFERTQRLGLLETYRLLDSAEAIVVPGSDDPAYNASKLAPCLLTGQPLLAMFHAASPAHALARTHAGVRLLAFDDNSEAAAERLRDAIDREFLTPPMPARQTAPDLGDLEAGRMSERLVDLFNRVARA